MSDPNGRTHEPNLREVTTQIDGMERLYEERDRRYEDRFKAQETAVAAALAAAEKLTAAAFAASKEAILKAENSQTSYNAGHNDLSRKMETQYKEMIPRTEFSVAVKNIEDKIAELRESRSEGVGHKQGVDKLTAIAIAVAGLVAGYLARGGSIPGHP